METRWTLAKCASCQLPMDSQSGHVELGTELCQAPTCYNRQRAHARTLAGGSAWQVSSPPRWVFQPRRRSSTSSRRFEHIQFLYMWHMGVKRGFPLRLLHFLIGVYGGPRFLLVEKGEGGALPRNCPRSSPRWSWMTRSSRHSAIAPRCCDSFSQQLTRSRSTRGGILRETGDTHQ